MGKTDRQSRRERLFREMTVVLVRERKDTEAVEVAFSESARFYSLKRQHADFARILHQLQEAKDKRKAVSVLLDYPKGEMIYDVRPAGSTGEKPT